MKFFWHPESSCLITTTDDGYEPGDGLCEEIDRETYLRIAKREGIKVSAKVYTIADYTKVFNALVAQRKATMAEIDAKLDKIAAMMVSVDGTNADEETDVYLLLRNTKENFSGYQTKRDDKIKGFIETVGNRLLKRLNTQGVKSMRAASGTFYKEEVHRPSCSDWSVFYKWIAETDSFEALEKRVTKKFIVDYLEREKALPPGVSLNSHFEARVRKGNEA